jgi:hypothetical protein
MFRKYMHIERFRTVPVRGIELGECYIFPKLDGTNGSIWYEDGQIKCGSRNRELSLEDDNAGFCKWVLEQENIKLFFEKYPNIILYGEWLVPHTLKTYQDTAWRKFYIFDVMDGDLYLKYEDYQILMEKFNIDYVPAICKIKNPSYEKLVEQLEKNTFLIQDGHGTGEGIVIKNYNYANKYGKIIWAKIVKNEFKTKHQKCDVAEITDKKMIEEEIASKYVTQSLVEKEYAKIALEGWESKKIPQLLNTVYYCLIQEESWNIVKEFKRPTINFTTLYTLCIQKIKELLPHLF